MLQSEKQEFGSNPVKVRESNHYQQEYIQKFVENWDELIDWDRRAEGEGTFFIDVLRQRNAKRVLDVATGTGYHSVQLLKAGFDVTSADGNPDMLYRAFENAKNRNQILRTIHADWRLLSKNIYEKFDAIVCLGNSFTHLFSENDRRKTLAEFYSALKHDGILILDHRNYDAILDVGYSSKHKYYYCGGDVEVEPEYVDEGLARFCYRFADDSVFHLNMYPLRHRYMHNLLREVGFQAIESFGDFQSLSECEEPDFFIHIAEKKYRKQ